MSKVSLLDEEKSALIALYLAYRYGYEAEAAPVFSSGRLGNSLVNSIGDYHIKQTKLNSFSILQFGDDIALGSIGGKLKRKSLADSNRMRYEAGYGAVATYHKLTVAGHPVAESLFLKIYKELSEKQRAALDANDRYAAGTRSQPCESKVQ